MVLAFIRAGIENPRSYIVSAIIRYLQFPDLYQTNSTQFLDEVMRYDCPAKITARYISNDISLKGIYFKKGYKVWISFRLANFMEEVFENPFHFQLRKPNHNLSLGIGPHYCIGKDLTYKLTMRVIEQIINNKYILDTDLLKYHLDESPVFRRYHEPIYLKR